MVNTMSDQSTGVAALILVASTNTTSLNAYGTATASNAGMVTTRGGLGSPNTDILFGASGLTAGYFVAPGDTTTEVANAGNVTVTNTGMIRTHGAGVSAVVAHSYGTGTVTANLTGGTVTSSGANSYGVYFMPKRVLG